MYLQNKTIRGGRLEGTRLLVIPNAVRKFGKDSDREIFDPKELLSSSLDPEEAAEIALELYKSTKKAEYLRIAANYPNGEAQLLLAQFLDPEKTDAVIDGVEKNQVEAELFYSLAKENNVQETIAPQSAVASAEPENGIRPLDGATKTTHTPALSEVLALTQEQLQQMQLRAQLFMQKSKPKQPEFKKLYHKLPTIEEQDERQNAREFVDERLYLDAVNLSADEIYLLEDTLEEAAEIQKTRPEHQDWIGDLIYDLRYLKLRHELKFPKKDCSVEELIKWSQEIWFKNKNLVDYENIIFDKVRDKIDELKKLLYREDLQTKDPETLSKLKLLEEILMHVISRNAMLQENQETGGWKKHILSIAENENGHPEERSAAYLTLAIELLRDDPLHSSYDEDKVKKDAQYYRYLFQSAQLGCENAKETIHEICNNFMDSKTFSTEHIDFVFGAARLNIAAAQLLAVRLYLNNKIGDSLAGEVFAFVDDINKNRAFFDERFPGQIPMFKFVKDIESVDELKNIERNINNVDRLGIMQASQLQFEQREQQLQREIAELKRQLQQAQQGPEVKPDELPETPKESEPEKVLPTQPPQQTVGVKPDGARVEQVPSELASSPHPSYSQALQARKGQQKKQQ